MMKPRKHLALVLGMVAVFSLATYSIVDGLARLRSASAMAESANKFLGSLTTEQKAKALFGFSDEQRYDWHFIPRARKGLPFKELNAEQRRLATEFMKTGLGSAGY